MKAERSCDICSRPSQGRTYCDECGSMVERLRDLEVRDMDRGREALGHQRNEDGNLICAYTGVELTFAGGATDAEWDHVDPRGDPTSVVPTAAVVNRMKGEMTVAEFDAMIGALYEYRIAKRRPFNSSAFPAEFSPKSTARLRKNGPL